MKKIPNLKQNGFVYPFLMALIISIHFIMGIVTLNRLSQTYDEAVHLTSGYSYLITGKFPRNIVNILAHPPVINMFAAIPLLFQQPVLLTNHKYWIKSEPYSFSDIFLYHNTVDAEKMLNSSRVIILLMSCILCFFVFSLARELYGIKSGFLALLLYSFSSYSISFGTLATTDMGLAFFCFLGVFVFSRWLKNMSISNTLLLAIITALTIVSRYVGIVILLVYGLIYMFVRNQEKKNKLEKSGFFISVMLFCIVVTCTVVLVYRFKYFNQYIEGLEWTLNNAGKYGHSSFLAGQHSTRGWLYYYIVAFLIKTQIPFLAMLLLTSFFQIKYIKEKNNLLLLVPAVVFFVLASISKKQLGIRYMFPAFPFLYVWVSSVARLNFSNKNIKCLLNCFIISLTIWYIVEAIKVSPWHLSYFNQFVGGSRNGYKYLTDSNVDWGQGLKELGCWVRKNEQFAGRGIYMSYFGTGNPQYYGIKYRPVGFIDSLDPLLRKGDNIIKNNLENIVFAISATNLQATYYKEKEIFDFLKDLEPVDIVAKSILIYDLTARPDKIVYFIKLLERLEYTDDINYIKNRF